MMVMYWFDEVHDKDVVQLESMMVNDLGDDGMIFVVEDCAGLWHGVYLYVEWGLKLC